jgi:tetratricopeptide (TPR) repeat protein
MENSGIMSLSREWVSTLWGKKPDAGQRGRELEIADVSREILVSSKSADFAPSQILLSRIKVLSDSIHLFNESTKLGTLTLLTNYLGVTAIEPSRFDEVQKTLINYLATCDSEVERLIGNKEYDAAIQALMSLSAIVPDPMTYQMRIAKIYEINGQRPLAIQMLENILSTHQKEAPQKTESQAACCASLASMYALEKNFAKSHEYLVQAVNLSPFTESYHIQLLDVLIELSLQHNAGPDPILQYINAVMDNVQKGNLVLSQSYYKDFCRAMQNAYERIGRSDYQTIAMRTLTRIGDYYVRQGNVEMAFALSQMASTVFRFPTTHALHNMDVSLTPQAPATPIREMGVYFGSLDSNQMKWGVLRGRQRSIDGNVVNTFDFKMVHTSRETLTQRLQLMAQSISPGSSISISDTNYTYRQKHQDGTFSAQEPGNYSIKGAKKIDFQGVGSVILMEDSKCGSLFNRIEIEIPGNLDPGEGLRRLHLILSYLGCPGALGEQGAMDDLRIKYLQLARTFFPSKMLDIERSLACQEMSPNALLQHIIGKIPEAQEVFKKYLFENSQLMQKIDILPGCPVWHIMDLADKIRSQGGMGLMSGVGFTRPIDEAAQTVSHMIKSGALASQTRLDCGIVGQGISPEDDHRHGSADCVFTRLVTGQQAMSLKTESFSLMGPIAVLYDLSILNRGAYAYPSDEYGVRNLASADAHTYRKRPNIFEVADMVDRTMSGENEYMLKFSIHPSFFKGFVVATDSDKEVLKQTLIKDGVASDRMGVLYITNLDKPFDAVVHVGQFFRREMWA